MESSIYDRDGEEFLLSVMNLWNSQRAVVVESLNVFKAEIGRHLNYKEVKESAERVGKW